MNILGTFYANYVIHDCNRQPIYEGQDICYVTNDTELIGLNWINKLDVYKQLQHKLQWSTSPERSLERSASTLSST